MQHKRKKFLASDHHFFHSAILTFGKDGVLGPRGTKWSNIQDHNQSIIDNHNSVVSPDDDIFFGGDLILSVAGEEAEFMQALNDTVAKMNGRKFIILGNHCTPAKTRFYIESGLFHAVCGCWEFKKTIIYSHIPVHESQMLRWKLNIHGHVHEKTLIDSRYYNVSLENINYTPIELDQIIDESNQNGVV